MKASALGPTARVQNGWTILLPVQEYYLSILSAPRPCRAGKMMAFSSDVDLAKLGRSGSSGSDTDGQQRKPAAFSSQLYNTLVTLHSSITGHLTTPVTLYRSLLCVPGQ